MNRLAMLVFFAGLVVLCSAAGVLAWDALYDASSGLLPTEASPPWTYNDYGASISFFDDALYIGPGGGATYWREAEAVAAGVPVTLETRMWGHNGTGGFANLDISTYSVEIHPMILSDRIVVGDRYGGTHIAPVDIDLYHFHTLRLAYDGGSAAYLWIDNQLAMSWAPYTWSPTETPGGIAFGAYKSHSVWQYVAYSKEFLPVPEPASFVVLAAGLAAMPWLRRRRRG